jgi:tetratricopeptide (TPR) repeat protein
VRISRLKDWAKRIWPVAPLLLAAALFARSLSFGFAVDDRTLIVERGSDFASARRIPGFFREGFWPPDYLDGYNMGNPYYRPLVTTLNALNVRALGPGPLGLHAVNLALHLCALSLLLVLMRRLGASRLAAATAGALFTAYPLTGCNVAWISGRTDLLCLVFLLGSLLLWLRHLDSGVAGGAPALAGALALFLLALLCKETALVFPAVLAVDLWRRRSRALFRRLPFWLIPIVAYLYLRRAAGVDWPTSPLGVATALRALGALGYDARTLFDPLDSVFLPDHSLFDRVDANLAVGLLAIGLFTVALWRHRDAKTGIGLACAIAFLIPTLGIAPASFPGASYCFYLPLAGLTLAATPLCDRLADWGARWQSGRWAIGCGAALALGALVAANVRYLGRFVDEEALARADLDADPDNSKALTKLGEIELERGRPAEAQARFARALVRNPSDATLYYNQGLCEQRLGNGGRAEALYRRALELGPAYLDARLNLGMVLLDQRRWDEALADFFAARDLRPLDRRARLDLLAGLNAAGRLEEALREYQSAIAMGIAGPDLTTNHGNTLLALGRLADAEAAYRQAIAQDAAYALSYKDLGLLYAKQLRDRPHAVTAFARYLELAPGDPDGAVLRQYLDDRTP